MRKWFNKYGWGVLLVFCILGIMAVGMNRQRLNQVDSRVEILGELNKTLSLSVLDSCGIITDGYGLGSCVAIGPNLILTAGHCIGIEGAWIEIGGVKYNIINKWQSDKYDVGFVEIDGCVPYLNFSPMPDVLQKVYLVGSPYSVVFNNTITKGIISKTGVDFIDWIDLIQTDAEGAPGSSGSPLLCKHGGILGICVSGPNPGGGVTLCEPVPHIIEALADYNKVK